MQQIKITQSLIKDYEAYVHGKECGLILKAKYVDGVVFPSSEVQKLGQWFEWRLTGALPKGGETPVPLTLKDGGLNAKYRLMETHIERFHEIMKSHGFEIIEKGSKLEFENLEGTVDIEAMKDGKVCFIDIKTSALMNDKWSEYGWHEDGIEAKEIRALQAIHYKILGMAKYDYEPDFFYIVFSTVNETDILIYQTEVDKSRFNAHIEKAQYIARALETETFTPAPDFKRCSDCPLKETCEYVAKVPAIKKIYFN